MYIPTKVITERHYVAIRKTKALYSCKTLDEALDCIKRYKDTSPYEFKTIKGVIKVTPAGREWVDSKILTQLLTSE